MSSDDNRDVLDGRSMSEKKKKLNHTILHHEASQHSLKLVLKKR